MGGHLVHRDCEHRSTSQPLTALQALMETPPGEEPAESTEEELARAPMLDYVSDALEQLDDIERLVIELYYLAKMSLRDMEELVLRPDGTPYRRTWIAHIRDTAVDKLREILGTDMFTDDPDREQ